MIYLPDPTVGVRGILRQIVASLGARPLVHHVTLVPQATKPSRPSTSNAAGSPSW